ncbi:MAG: tRNA (adenosine(37)-N6)-dimethylallyltransferase MiaA, partial [Eubacteriales bacterium]
LNGEIVSCDSMQIYKFMNIGSAKPTIDEQMKAKHYLIDAVDPRDEFSVAMYQTLAKEAIFTIIKNGKLPIVAGGTGLYANSLIYDMDFSVSKKDDQYREKLMKIAESEGSKALHDMLRKLDPDAATRIHENNLKKVIRSLEILNSGGQTKEFEKSFQKTKDYDVDILGITRNRQQLYDRINKRVDILIEKGLVDEVKMLLNMGIMDSDIAMKAIGYKEILPYIRGEVSLDFAVDLIKKNSRHYAKRQMTWFKRYKNIKWFNLSDYETEDIALEDMLKWYQNLIR